MQADDLRAGTWVIVLESWETHHHPFYGECESRNEMVSGLPLQVLSVSLPFVVVTDGQYHYPIDTRCVKFGRVSKQYVKALKGTKLSEYGLILEEPASKQKQASDKKACPSCGDRMVERLVGDGLWSLACNQCGLQGGIPPQGTPYLS